jgi:hypothetical protein
MEFSHRFAAAICGTSCMTAFSYGISFLSKKQFREPILLSHLLSHSPANPSLYSAKKKAAAWLIHYGVGLFFSMAYKNDFVNGKKRAAGAKGLLLGAAFGCVGVSGWLLAFKLHPNPPKIEENSYLIHLIPAHLVFGSTAGLTAGYFSRAGKNKKAHVTQHGLS